MLTYVPRPRRRRGPLRSNVAGHCRHTRVGGAGRLGALMLLLLLAGGCDLPTSLPRWDTQWLLPVRNTSFTVAQLLPATVSTTPDRSAFLVDVAPVTISRTLGSVCAACVPLSGLYVPKPAFTATVSDTLRLPSDVGGATLVGGSMALTITNGLGFDPLRPGATARGTLTITLSSGTTNLGSVTLDGASDSLPPNSTVTRSISLGAGPISGRIAVTMAVSSPAGDPVRIDASQSFSLTATPQTTRLSDVTVQVNGKSVSLQPEALNVSGIDPSLVDQVTGGALLLTVTNPFNVAGTLTLTISGPGVTIVKPLPITPSSVSEQTTQRIPLTQQELRSMLGKSGVTFTATGTVSGATVDPQGARYVKVTPSQAVLVTALLELTLGATS